jgi:iron(II)-dependent oxidoreductase
VRPETPDADAAVDAESDGNPADTSPESAWDFIYVGPDFVHTDGGDVALDEGGFELKDIQWAEAGWDPDLQAACENLTFGGCCVKGTTKYGRICGYGKPHNFTCEDDSFYGPMKCDWSEWAGFYHCFPENPEVGFQRKGYHMDEDPTGEFPRDCPEPCTRDCTGRECGTDGCYGTCGECDSGTKCADGRCEPCTSSCAAKECGDDGCGGLCGVCGGGRLCEDARCVDAPCAPHCGDMVTVPAGPFTMGGKHEDGWCFPLSGTILMPTHCDNEHEVYVPAFTIDRLEVTLERFQRCVDAGACLHSEEFFQHRDWYEPWWSYDNSFVQARRFCRWEGKRLCTEAEWEKAGRGTDRRLYPWGNDPPECGDIAGLFDCPDTGPGMGTGSYPKDKSPCGAMDLLGLAREWVEDQYHENNIGSPPDGSAWVDDPGSYYRTRRGGGPRPQYTLLYREYSLINETNGIRCCAAMPFP